MTSSGTYNFSQANSDVVLGAYGRLQIRRTALLAEHMLDAYRQANLALVSLAVRQPNLWTEETQEIALLDGVATYTLPARTVMILISTIRTGTGVTQNDRVIFPVSTVEYQSFPNKAQPGFPSVYWFSRLITPTITFWTVPDATGVYTARLQTVRQVQDANLPSGETPDIPYRWLDWFEADLAHRLSRFYKPELEAQRKVDAAEAWTIAATDDTENVDLVIAPQLGHYYGR